VVGPTLGGWIADNISWQWCFLINGPVGVVALGLIGALLREAKEAVAGRKLLARQNCGFDLVGFALVATFLGALEIALDRGLEDDWFSSRFIVVASAICALAFLLMIPWELSHRNPMIDVRMVATRQFGASFLVMLGAGAILLATTQYLPQLVQQNFGYTATLAGLVLTPGGIVTVFMMPLVGQLTGKVQPRYLIATGAAICAFAMYDMTKVNGDLGFWFFAVSRIYIGIGLPLVFLPIIAASYVDGLFHRARQFARAGSAAGFRLDRAAGPDPGELSRLRRRVLDIDADLACRRTARAHAAQGQAQRCGSPCALMAH